MTRYIIYITAVLLITTSAYGVDREKRRDPLGTFLGDVFAPRERPHHGLSEEQRQKIAMLDKVSKDLDEVQRALEQARRSIHQMKDKIIFRR